jgi:hypothetical protein
VLWPDGTRTVVEDVASNQILTVRKEAGR